MRAWRLKDVRGTQGQPGGSALILTVVLTTLLAIVAVLFMMTARIDKMASSAATENEQLGLAVDTVVSQASEMLARGVPGMPGYSTYYVYPDVNNPWLADLEPYASGSRYYWRQITDLTGSSPSGHNNVPIEILAERVPITADPNADADGDGVSDAQWYRLPGIVSGKGRPIYAAVRIVDNSAMLNLNTAWGEPYEAMPDWRSPLNIDVPATLGRSRDDLVAARDPNRHLPAVYENDVVWKYLSLPFNSPYTPFDVSDEMEMRYRFLLHHEGSACRAETWGPFRNNVISTPVDANLALWYSRVRLGGDPCGPEAKYYAWRHAVTTYNMDRILTPRPVAVADGNMANKRINVNTAGEEDMYQAILAALTDRNPGNPNLEVLAAQITVNLRDYIDDDNDVSAYAAPASGSGAMVYGFERPCVYLSEIAYRFVKNPKTGGVAESFAIELYKPFFADGDIKTVKGDIKGNKWRVEVRYAGAAPVQQAIEWSGIRRFHVLSLQNTGAQLPVDFNDANEADAARVVKFERNSSPTEQRLTISLPDITTIALQRNVGGTWLDVDYKILPAGFTSPAGDPNDPNAANGLTRCLQRDISDGKCILRSWGSASKPNLGNGIGNHRSTNPVNIQAYPTNHPLRNIGELGMVFWVNASSGTSDSSRPEDVLIDLCDPRFADLFNYLTVVDPTQHGQSAAETRVMGRININTAPWPVIAALPYVQYRPDGVRKSPLSLYPTGNVARAQAIVAQRETAGAFRSIGDLMQVAALRLPPDQLDNCHDPTAPTSVIGPDLTPDYVLDDQEERDSVFMRLSDLVTVRSDVFTAYILVRIGEKGPQKRMVALLDRSQVSPANPKVRVVALYAVADPR